MEETEDRGEIGTNRPVIILELSGMNFCMTALNENKEVSNPCPMFWSNQTRRYSSIRVSNLKKQHNPYNAYYMLALVLLN